MNANALDFIYNNTEVVIFPVTVLFERRVCLGCW